MNSLPHLTDDELKGTLLSALRVAADVYGKSAADLKLPPTLRQEFTRQEREALDLAEKLNDEAGYIEPIAGLER